MSGIEEKIKKIKKYPDFINENDDLSLHQISVVDIFMFLVGGKIVGGLFLMCLVPTALSFILPNISLIIRQDFMDTITGAGLVLGLSAFYTLLYAFLIEPYIILKLDKNFRAKFLLINDVKLVMNTRAGEISYFRKKYYLNNKTVTDPEILADIKNISDSYFHERLDYAIENIEDKLKEKKNKKENILKEKEMKKNEALEKAKKEEEYLRHTLRELAKDQEKIKIEKMIKENPELPLKEAVKEIEKQKERLEQTAQ